MGWKTLKDHYNIGHIVHVRDGEICIGSPYITRIFAVNKKGELVGDLKERSNLDLKRYIFDMIPDQGALLAEIFAMKDSFGTNLKVFSINEGRVTEDYCERFGWPNVTHSGDLMYDNSHFLTYEQARKRLLKETKSDVKYTYLKYYFTARIVKTTVKLYKIDETKAQN